MRAGLFRKDRALAGMIHETRFPGAAQVGTHQNAGWSNPEIFPCICPSWFLRKPCKIHDVPGDPLRNVSASPDSKERKTES